MFKGIILALCACLIWGLIFVVPLCLKDFSCLEITLGRYFFFGIISMIFFFSFSFKKLIGYPLKFWYQALIFALVANFSYYIVTVLGIKYSSPGITALIAGIGPVSISLYGNFKERDCCFSKLVLPTILILVGLVITKIEIFSDGETNLLTLEHLFGIFCAFLGLALWTWFVVANNRFLKTNSSITYFEWSTMIGVATFAFVVFALIVFRIFIWNEGDLDRYFQFSEEMQLFILATGVLGFLCSWLGTFLWNSGSTKLPVSFVGQLTIFETLFGLIFVYLYEDRMPTVYEGIGIFLMLGAIFYTMRIFLNGRASLSGH